MREFFRRVEATAMAMRYIGCPRWMAYVLAVKATIHGALSRRPR